MNTKTENPFGNAVAQSVVTNAISDAEQQRAIAETQAAMVITKNNAKKYANLEQITGYVDVQQGATFTAPALAEVSCCPD